MRVISADHPFEEVAVVRREAQFLRPFAVLGLLVEINIRAAERRRKIGGKIGAERLELLTIARRRRQRDAAEIIRSEEHTSELQSLMRISYAVFCLKKNKQQK